jgi:hypothetical protein
MNNNIEGTYTLQDDLLVGEVLTLRVGTRHKVKKGQAKRFIGFIDPTKPETEQFSYISSLYSKQGLKNAYKLEYEGQIFDLHVTGINTVKIIKSQTERALVFDNSEGRGKQHEYTT